MLEGIRIRGARYFKGYLGEAAQNEVLGAIREVVQLAPLFQPETRWGKKMSVRMTSAGRLGWFSDRRGYRYVRRHPDGSAWPEIPAPILDIWSDLVGGERIPDCCLINFYGEGSKMGLHQDRDEADFRWPVISISLGDEALFRIGGAKRSDPTDSFRISSGDVVILEGESRLSFHGIDRIRFGSSRLLPDGGRVNITLRVVE